MSDALESPIACTLQGSSYQERLAWIAELSRDGLRGHSRQELTLVLHYEMAIADRVAEMVQNEKKCCAFLDFQLTKLDDGVRLTITAPERARDVADALFEQFLPSGVSESRASIDLPAACCDDAEASR
jgi:hypothetical protein